MTPFLGTHQNKLDAKGRVSIPAPFRQSLRILGGSENATGISMILRPSHQYSCIEAWPEKQFAELANRLITFEEFSVDYDDFATALYAQAVQVESDKEGRIVLPGNLANHAGLTEGVTFIGIGKTFQIWEPAAAERRLVEANGRTKENRLTLPRASAA